VRCPRAQPMAASREDSPRAGVPPDARRDTVGEERLTDQSVALIIKSRGPPTFPPSCSQSSPGTRCVPATRPPPRPPRSRSARSPTSPVTRTSPCCAATSAQRRRSTTSARCCRSRRQGSSTSWQRRLMQTVASRAFTLGGPARCSARVGSRAGARANRPRRTRRGRCRAGRGRSPPGRARRSASSGLSRAWRRPRRSASGGRRRCVGRRRSGASGSLRRAGGGCPARRRARAGSVRRDRRAGRGSGRTVWFRAREAAPSLPTRVARTGPRTRSRRRSRPARTGAWRR